MGVLMNERTNKHPKVISVIIEQIYFMFRGIVLSIVIPTIIFSHTKGGKSLMFLIPNHNRTILTKNPTHIPKFLNGEIFYGGIKSILVCLSHNVQRYDNNNENNICVCQKF
jgi:hypothetical protein